MEKREYTLQDVLTGVSLLQIITDLRNRIDAQDGKIRALEEENKKLNEQIESCSQHVYF